MERPSSLLTERERSQAIATVFYAAFVFAAIGGTGVTLSVLVVAGIIRDPEAPSLFIGGLCGVGVLAGGAWHVSRLITDVSERQTKAVEATFRKTPLRINFLYAAPYFVVGDIRFNPRGHRGSTRFATVTSVEWCTFRDRDTWYG